MRITAYFFPKVELVPDPALMGSRSMGALNNMHEQPEQHLEVPND